MSVRGSLGLVGGEQTVGSVKGAKEGGDVPQRARRGSLRRASAGLCSHQPRLNNSSGGIQRQCDRVLAPDDLYLPTGDSGLKFTMGYYLGKIFSVIVST